MTFGLIYLGVFVILNWAFLLTSNLGAGYRYKFWPVSAPVYGLKLIVIWVIDVKLVDQQFPAGQNQDDRQVAIFGRHLPAAGRQI